MLNSLGSDAKMTYTQESDSQFFFFSYFHCGIFKIKGSLSNRVHFIHTHEIVNSNVFFFILQFTFEIRKKIIPIANSFVKQTLSFHKSQIIKIKIILIVSPNYQLLN